MKRLKLLIISILALFFAQCTDDFMELNTNPINPTEVQVDLVFHRSLKRPYGGWEYQVGHNLFSNYYAQYIANTKDGFKSGRYIIPSGWNNVIWGTFYLHINPQFLYIDSLAKREPLNSNKLEIARIWKVHQAQFIVDTYGDVPYLNTGKGVEQLPYNTQKEIYYSFFEELKTAVSNISSDANQFSYGSYDSMFEGNADKWIRFANSLRLRYAIRISRIDPEKARAEGEAALASNLISSNNDNAALIGDREDVTNGHNLRNIANWNEFRASSTFVDILNNTSDIQDPRTTLFWSYPYKAAADGGFRPVTGLHNGLDPSKLGNANDTCSNLGPAIIRDRDYMIMNYSEVCFLKAEAALLGWNGAGDAQENYEEGVRASFSYWDDQIKNHTTVDLLTHSVDKDLALPKLEAQLANIIQQNTLSQEQATAYMVGQAAWNNTDTDEQKLRKIITQKYIANFPDGMESWCEYRRTGYPSEIKPVIDPAPGTVPQGMFIQKLNYVEEEYNKNNQNASNSNNNNGQGDGLQVKLWWVVP